jgi:hypothetical protein
VFGWWCFGGWVFSCYARVAVVIVVLFCRPGDSRAPVLLRDVIESGISLILSKALVHCEKVNGGSK